MRVIGTGSPHWLEVVLSVYTWSACCNNGSSGSCSCVLNVFQPFTSHSWVCWWCIDGTFWHPMISKSEKLYIFNADLCRSVYTTCDGTESVVSGVTTYHFKPPPSVFASTQQNPDNAGFCTPANNCLKAGVLNISRCRGTQVVYSGAVI